MRTNTGIAHCQLRHATPFKDESCPAGQHVQKLALGSPVTLTEWVNVVYFSKHDAGFTGERTEIALQVSETTGCGQSLGYFLKCQFDRTMREKNSVVLAYVDLAKLPGPGVDILEYEVMERLQVLQGKVSLQRRFLKLNNPGRSKVCLGLIEGGGFTDIK
ncbi:hypothetical protein ACVW0A_003865 [Pseudomonas sp. TE3610]